MSAAGYCRISYDPTGREAGVERQRRDVTRLATDLGIDLAEIVIDNDRSASRSARRRREGWDQLLADITAGAITTLVAYDIDWVTRNPRDLETLIDAAEDHGLRIHVVTGEFPDLSTAMGQAAARVLMALAAAEAKKTSDRQKAKLRHDAAAGRPHWTRRPYGYTSAAEVVPVERSTVRRMARRVLEGASATKVATELNAEGITTAAGKPWQQASVVFTLTSPRTAGLRAYRGEIVGEATWEPLIDRKTWQAVTAAIDARRRGPKQSPRVGLLTGLVECGLCGARIYRNRGGSDRAEYACTKQEGCRRISIKAPPVEEFVTEAVLTMLGDVEPAETSSPDAAEEVAEIEDEMNRLAAMYGSGELSSAEWQAMRGPLRDRLGAARDAAGTSKAGTAFDTLTGDLSTIADRWDQLDLDVKHRLVELVVERITVAPAEKGQDMLDRITITWRA